MDIDDPLAELRLAAQIEDARARQDDSAALVSTSSTGENASPTRSTGEKV